MARSGERGTREFRLDAQLRVGCTDEDPAMFANYRSSIGWRQLQDREEGEDARSCALILKSFVSLDAGFGSALAYLEYRDSSSARVISRCYSRHAKIPYETVVLRVQGRSRFVAISWPIRDKAEKRERANTIHQIAESSGTTSERSLNLDQKRSTNTNGLTNHAARSRVGFRLDCRR